MIRNQLGEVVVTALGLKREEKALGYAVTEVKSEELIATNTVNPVAVIARKSSRCRNIRIQTVVSFGCC